MTDPRPRLCVVILTLNEATQVGHAIASARPVGDVLVLDSGSTDETAAVARASGATVAVKAWQGFAQQRNHALQLCTDYEWVVFLDADETLDPQLTGELRSLPTSPSDTSGYLVRRKNHFLGKELPHAGRYPDWQLRVMRPAKSVFEEAQVHERAAVEGDVAKLQGHLIHFSTDSASDFLAKHSEYARLEAHSVVVKSEAPPLLSLFPPSRLAVRRYVKERLWLKLPCRGAIRIVWLMVVKRGFLDGPEAWAYAKMLAAYECMIDVYAAELRSPSGR